MVFVITGRLETTYGMCKTLLIALGFFTATITAADGLYEIAPHRGKSLEELYDLTGEYQDPFLKPVDPTMPEGSCSPYFDGGDYVRAVCSSVAVDEPWKELSNIYQAMYHNDRDIGFFDIAFTMCCVSIRQVDDGLMKDGSYYPNPRDALFFYWKQAAWVHPDYAQALAYALTHGFDNKVPVNPAWAPYWLNRAVLLRAAADNYYVPQDWVATRLSGNGTSIEKFYAFVKSQTAER